MTDPTSPPSHPDSLGIETFRRIAGSAHLVKVMEATGAAVFSVGSGRRINGWDETAERLFGYTAGEALGQPLDLIVPEDLRAEADAIYDRAEAGDPTYEFRTMRQVRTGELIPVALSVFSLSSPDRQEKGYGVVIRDLRPRERIRRALEETTQRQQETQELLAAIVDNSRTVMVVKDVEGRYLLVNREWERVTGMSREAALGALDRDLLPPGVFEAIREQDRVAIDQRAPTEYEGTYRWPNGEERYTMSVWVPLFGPDGAVERICSFSTDISDRKRTQDAIETANRAKTEFLSRMSHELRTPLNVVLGFAQLLQLGPLSADQDESVDYILKAGQHLLSLIDEVLDLSRIESDRLPLSLEPIVVEEMLAEAVGLMRSFALNGGISLEFHAPPEIHRVRGDRQRMKQVMLNLLSNAIKYNRPGGRVTVSCDGPADGLLHISVTDTGIGIPADRMDRLFEPFERLGAEATTVEGTGLGLTLSRRLVHAMGGEIRVASVVGDGTTFVIEMPLATGEHEQERPKPGLPRHHLATPGTAEDRLILYIEDNLANVQLVERLLQRVPGARLMTAMQGRLGLDLAREHQPDVIVLDLHLPDLAGERVLRELKADARTNHIPVIVASADATVGAVERLLQSGAAAYITKPLDIAEFLRLIETATTPAS